jgi:hypothetical protein
VARVISDRTIKALLKGHPPDDAKFDRYGRCELVDAGQPGFGIRWNGRDKVSFLAFARFGDSKNPVRRTIGIYGAATDSQARVFTLADARAEADRWRNQGRAGKDPKADHARALRARQRHTASTFEKAAEEFFKVKMPHERKGDEVARDIRKEFVGRWAKRPSATSSARTSSKQSKKSATAALPIRPTIYWATRADCSIGLSSNMTWKNRPATASGRAT